jgi:hypothetical protein
MRSRLLLHKKAVVEVVVMKAPKLASGYDLGCGVTFLLIGLGIGALWAFVFNPMPKSRIALMGIRTWRSPAVPLQEKLGAKRRVA